VKTIEDVLFDRNFLTILVNPEQSLIHLKWKGFANSEQFREGLNAALEIVKEQRLKNWLANQKMMEMIMPQDEEWASNNWYPRVALTGLKKMAIVTSLDFLNNASVRRIVSAASGKNDFETRYFVDSGEAKEWLSVTLC
jgi:hypothetical protein